MRSDANSRPAVALAALLGGTGVLHFAAPKPFDALIPRQLPGSPRTWTPPIELSERAELHELRRRVREQEMELAFLKKAAAYFAREQR